MFKKLFLILFVSFILIESSQANLDVKARTAILLDYHSNEILFEMDADRIIFPASMTKIMTSKIAFDLIFSDFHVGCQKVTEFATYLCQSSKKNLLR